MPRRTDPHRRHPHDFCLLLKPREAQLRISFNGRVEAGFLSYHRRSGSAEFNKNTDPEGLVDFSECNDCEKINSLSASHTTCRVRGTHRPRQAVVRFTHPTVFLQPQREAVIDCRDRLPRVGRRLEAADRNHYLQRESMTAWRPKPSPECPFSSLFAKPAQSSLNNL